MLLFVVLFSIGKERGLIYFSSKSVCDDSKIIFLQGGKPINAEIKQGRACRDIEKVKVVFMLILTGAYFTYMLLFHSEQ